MIAVFLIGSNPYSCLIFFGSLFLVFLLQYTIGSIIWLLINKLISYPRILRFFIKLIVKIENLKENQLILVNEAKKFRFSYSPDIKDGFSSYYYVNSMDLDLCSRVYGYNYKQHDYNAINHRRIWCH